MYNLHITLYIFTLQWKLMETTIKKFNKRKENDRSKAEGKQNGPSKLQLLTCSPEGNDVLPTSGCLQGDTELVTEEGKKEDMQ